MEYKDMAAAINEIVEAGFLPYINNFYDTEAAPTVGEIAKFLEECEKPAIICKLTNEIFEDLYYEYLEDIAMWKMDSGVFLQVELDETDEDISISYYTSATADSFATLQFKLNQTKSIVTDAIDTADSVIVNLVDSIGLDKLEKVNLVINY